MTDAAAQVEAARRALADAEAALAAERSTAAASTGPATGPLTTDQVETIRAGYTFDAPALEMGALVNGDVLRDVPIRIPISMLNRHGLVAGATGTGKTRTLQVLAEQLAANGVPVFAADIKGDLSGIASPGASSEKLLARTESLGQDWKPTASTTEFFSLGGQGMGIPIRATVSGFGPLLLSKVLGLNATQESSLGLVFHYADSAGLPLVDLSDLRAVLTWLVSDEGKPELAQLGGISKATAGVILRELITFANEGADVFFGEPEFDTNEFLRTNPDGTGLVSLLELPGVHDKPALFSTFLMWLIAELFNDLPEVGDLDKPKLVFFFDEAHLLFNGASKDFVAAITQTVRLIRSKGVGIVFVTQTPKDVPTEVLEQIGSRVQHQLRAHTPDAAKALKLTVSTYPTSGYDLQDVLTTLATGEAIVTVMNEKGAPSPVAWTRLACPAGFHGAVAGVAPAGDSGCFAPPRPLRNADRPRVRTRILAVRMNAAAAADSAKRAEADQIKLQKEYEKVQREFERASRPKSRPTTTRTPAQRREKNPIDAIFGSRTGQTVVREVLRGVFGTLKRR